MKRTHRGLSATKLPLRRRRRHFLMAFDATCAQGNLRMGRPRQCNHTSTGKSSFMAAKCFSAAAS
jgi:hypothetical protein